jgi:formylglycine-generating enzyme required for sulfatase activity
MNKNGHRMISVAAQPKGQTFWMGALDHEKGYAAAVEPRYAARIDRPYAIAATETTVAQMEKFLQGYRQRYDRHRKAADQTRPGDADQQSEPASFVPLLHALAYCNWLSKEDGIPKDQWCYKQDRLDALLAEEKQEKEPTYSPLDADDIAQAADLSRIGYRLPTEVEWEYACRAGTESSRFFGDSAEHLDSFAHYRNNSTANTLSPVGRHMPNAWGLFDALGNVAEWCYGGARQAAGSEHGAPRCGLRGGSLNDEAVVVRCSYRILVPVNAAQRDIGFRVARTLKGE